MLLWILNLTCGGYCPDRLWDEVYSCLQNLTGHDSDNDSELFASDPSRMEQNCEWVFISDNVYLCGFGSADLDRKWNLPKSGWNRRNCALLSSTARHMYLSPNYETVLYMIFTVTKCNYLGVLLYRFRHFESR